MTVTEASATEPISMAISNDFPVGGLRVTKTIGRNDADLDLDDIPYGFHYECSFDPGAGPPITIEGDLVATVNDPAEVDGLPAGAECVVEETDAQGAIPNDPVTVTIVAGTILQPYTPAPFTNDYPTGRAELVKLLDGGAQDEFTGGPYSIAVDCVGPGQTESFPGFPVVVEVVPNEPVGTELPIGTTCVFRELDPADGVTVTYDPANPDGSGGLVVVPSVEPPPDQEPIATVTVTNTYTTGSLVITKQVSGPGVPAFSQGPFVFDVSCDYQGVEDVYSVAVVIPGSPDGTPVESDPVTGLPIGASCTVTEIDAGGADIVTPPQTVTIAEDGQANVAFVGVDNPFSAATISVVKRVDGTAATSAYVAALRYPIVVQCAVEDDSGILVTVLDQTVTVAGDGVARAVTDTAGAPVLVPLGARCWGSEADPAGATRVTIDHDSYANGVEVVASADLQPLQITVTNTFDAASLSITKHAINAPSSAAAYTVTVTCTVTGPDGTSVPVPLVAGSSPLTIRSGETVTITALAEAVCTVAEPNPGGASVTLAETGGTDGNAADGVVTLDGDRSVVVTNRFSGVLPSTGSTGAQTVLSIAAALVAAGALLLAGRRLRVRHRR